MATPAHQANEYVLTYFNGRGHGERVRYAMMAAGISWREVNIKAVGDLDKVRDKCLFRQGVSSPTVFATCSATVS